MIGRPIWLLRIVATGLMGKAAESNDFWGMVVAQAALRHIDKNTRFLP